MNEPKFTHKRKRGIKTRLWIKQGGDCYICKEPLSTNRKSANFATIDHIIPMASMRGLNAKSNNLALACYVCNQAKGCASGVTRVLSTGGHGNERS